MSQLLRFLMVFNLLSWVYSAHGQVPSRIVDIPTRPGITQRVLVITPHAPKAAVILFAGGHGGLQLTGNGNIGWGKNNFLVRSRQLFADQGFMTVLIDAPSDRQVPPFLTGFRQTSQHVEDVKAVISWVRERANIPVWLVGTSRGTQSVAYIATELASEPPRRDGPDGIVLSSTILSDNNSVPVTSLPLEKITVPVLVVHHELDGCRLCSYSLVPSLMQKLSASPRKAVLNFTGGTSRGDPCEASSHHGYNGIEGTVVNDLSAWILQHAS